MTQDRDEDLDALLEPLRQAQPAPAQLRRWRASLSDARAATRLARAPRWLQLAAAACVGFAVGGWLFSRPDIQQAHSVVEVDRAAADDDATVVYLFAKSE